MSSVQYREIQSPQVIKCIGTENSLRLFLCPCDPDKSTNKGLLVSWFNYSSKTFSYQFRTDKSSELQCEKDIFIKNKGTFEKLKAKTGYIGAISSESGIFQKFWLIGTYEEENKETDENEEKKNESIVICFSENPCSQENWNILSLSEDLNFSIAQKEPYEYGIFPLKLESDSNRFDEYLVFVGTSKEKEATFLIYNTDNWKIESYNEFNINEKLNNYILFDINNKNFMDRVSNLFGNSSNHYHYLCFYKMDNRIHLNFYPDASSLMDGNPKNDKEDPPVLETEKNVEDFWICKERNKKNSFVIAWITKEKDAEKNLICRLHIGKFKITPKKLIEDTERIAINKIKTLKSNQSLKGSVSKKSSLRLCQGKNNEFWIGFVSEQDSSENSSFPNKNIVISKFTFREDNYHILAKIFLIFSMCSIYQKYRDYTTKFFEKIKNIYYRLKKFKHLSIYPIFLVLIIFFISKPYMNFQSLLLKMILAMLKRPIDCIMIFLTVSSTLYLINSKNNSNQRN